MLSDRLHFKPRAAVLLWLLRCEIQIRGRDGAWNTNWQLNWMGSHQPIRTVPQTEGVKRQGCQDARFMEEGHFPLYFLPPILPP